MSDLNETNTMSRDEAGQDMIMDELVEDVGNDVDGDKFLTFHIGETAYGVDIIRIKEIIEFGGITQIPMTPPCIRGVINLRGNVVPVVDLGERFEVSQHKEVTRRTCVIITEVQDDGEVMDIGFVVDAVDQVVGIPEERIEAAPSFGTDVDSKYIFGMGNVNDRFVTLLDMDTVFSVDELATLVEEAME